jgi:hypothetical protein
MVGEGVGYQWIFAVVILLDVDIGLVSSAASSGLISSLDHDGRQMLGQTAEDYLFLNTKV